MRLMYELTHANEQRIFAQPPFSVFRGQDAKTVLSSQARMAARV
jgi:hypothetical protein